MHSHNPLSQPSWENQGRTIKRHQNNSGFWTSHGSQEARLLSLGGILSSLPLRSLVAPQITGFLISWCLSTSSSLPSLSARCVGEVKMVGEFHRYSSPTSPILNHGDSGDVILAYDNLTVPPLGISKTLKSLTPLFPPPHPQLSS